MICLCFNKYISLLMV